MEPLAVWLVSYSDEWGAERELYATKELAQERCKYAMERFLFHKCHLSPAMMIVQNELPKEQIEFMRDNK